MIDHSNPKRRYRTQHPIEPCLLDTHHVEIWIKASIPISILSRIQWLKISLIPYSELKPILTISVIKVHRFKCLMFFQ